MVVFLFLLYLFFNNFLTTFFVMKKILLTCSLVVSSVFFAYAQFDLGGVKVNVGQVCKTEGQKKLCLNPSTGDWMVTDGDGVIGGNTNTGAIGGSGSINGIGINGGYSGTQQGGLNTTSGLGGILGTAQGVLRFLVPFLIGLALLAFFWYIILYIWKGKDDPSAYAKGKVGMFYSLLALFIMVSVWGIITFFGQIVGIGQGGGMTGFEIPGKK